MNPGVFWYPSQLSKQKLFCYYAWQRVSGRGSVKITIIPARSHKDARALSAFDRRTFPNKEDHATPSYFLHQQMRSFWLLLGRKRVGACTVIRHATWTKDPCELAQHKEGSLYIVSTAILPEWRGIGMATILKAWQIAYAHTEGFRTIITNARASNRHSIALNKKFAFREIQRVGGVLPRRRNSGHS